MIYLDLFLGFLKVGCFAFGGAYGAIPLIRDVVMSYGWLSDEMLTYMIAVSESTPGPIMVNLATYIEKQVCSSRSPWFETLCDRHCVGYWHLYGFGKLLRYSFCNHSKFTGNHHYSTFGCFDVWI